MTDWPDSVELDLDGIAQGGEGVGRWEGRVVFVAGGLPGERVQVALRERHASYARGDITQIERPSPDRVAPRDPGAPHMGWQHIAHPAQLAFKRSILREQLAKIAGLADVPVEETCAPVPQWGYRVSARMHSDGRAIGYREEDGQAIAPVAHDPLLHPALGEALAALRSALAEHPGEAPFEVLLRASDSYGYALGALEGQVPLRMLAARWRARCPSLAGVAIGTRPPLVVGADRLAEEVDGLALLLRPSTFFQVCVAGAEALLGLVRDGLALQGGERLLDLYCGAGVLTLPLARGAAEVVGVEQWGGAVLDAEESAAINGIENVRFVTGSVERALQQIDGPLDAVVLDPPRRGCHPNAIGELLRLAPRRIVYVSCQPATLARDVRLLAAGGYQVERVTPVDLFPQTPHIESVTVLSASA